MSPLWLSTSFTPHGKRTCSYHQNTLSVWLSLTGSFFYDIMNVPNPSPGFGNRFLFGAILRIDRFVFTQTVFFLCTKKIPNRQTKRIGIPYCCSTCYLPYHRDIVTKKDGLFNPSPFDLCEKQSNNRYHIIKKVRASQALTDKKERKNYVIDGFYPTYHNYILSISY